MTVSLVKIQGNNLEATKEKLKKRERKMKRSSSSSDAARGNKHQSTKQTGKSLYTRPGVECAVQLVNMIDSDDAATTNKHIISIFEQIEGQYMDMLRQKGGEELIQFNAKCELIGQRLQQRGSNNGKKGDDAKSLLFTKDDLMDIVRWKFAKGKPRYPLLKQIQFNTDALINTCIQNSLNIIDEYYNTPTETTTKTTNVALKKSKNDANNRDTETTAVIRQSIDALCQDLKGIGPATASAVLSLYKPQLYAFMDDEVIEALIIPGKKRGYTIPIYIDINNRCIQIASRLNRIMNDNNNVSTSSNHTTNPIWTPRRIGIVLWTVCKLGSVPSPVATSLTKNDPCSEDDDTQNNNKEGTDETVDEEEPADELHPPKKHRRTTRSSASIKKKKTC